MSTAIPRFNTTTSGTVTSDGDTVAATLAAFETAVLIVANGTLKGTLVFEVSLDGTNWAGVQLAATTAPAAPVSSAAVDGSGGAITTAWSGSVAGWANVRARLHPTTSGSATVKVLTA